MNWNSKSILITGAGGFIGSHLAEQVIERGARVRAFVRYNSRGDWGMLKLLPKHKLDEIEVCAGDLRDSHAVHCAVRKTEIVFHLGALIAIPYSYIHPRETIETNVMGALNVMSAASEVGVDRVIHTSTSEVYGTARYVPMDEKHPLQGQSPYSASKIGADMVAESFHRSFGLPVTIIRPFNTFGPRQSARAVIPTIITQALTPVSQLVLGSTYPMRDYTYIENLVNAFIKAAVSQDSIGETINIGSGSDISIGDIAKQVMSILGVDKPIALDSKRVRPVNSEVERLCCDNTKARKLLDWEPRISFEEGLKKTIQWFSANLGFCKPDIYNV
jgi:NAD dependent epimerase/dehydratase